jgi:hypothetical protein
MSGGVAQRRTAKAWWVCSLLVAGLAAFFVRPIGKGTNSIRISKGAMHGVRLGTMEHFVMIPVSGSGTLSFRGRTQTRIVSPLKFTGKSSSWGSQQVIVGSPSLTRTWLIAF